MGGHAGLLEPSAGSVLRLDGADWTVAEIDPRHGRGLLGNGGDDRWRIFGGWRTTVTARPSRWSPPGMPPGRGSR